MSSVSPGRSDGAIRYMKKAYVLLPVALILLVLCLGGCAGKKPYAKRPDQMVRARKSQQQETPKGIKKKNLPRMGFTIQAGAFKKAENAARFTETLKEKGLDATYFVAKTGLYRVSFGNFREKSDAEALAAILKSLGIIEDFYIVSPEQYTVTKAEVKGEAYLRAELVKTTQSFLGVPYLWGGTSRDEGFDCSGLTMTVYRLHGLDLPRTSQEQFEAGEPIDRAFLKEGDLVFFATRGGHKVSHVGVYIGGGRFVHAPGKGKRIREDSLSNPYYARRYLGAKSYI